MREGFARAVAEGAEGADSQKAVNFLSAALLLVSCVGSAALSCFETAPSVHTLSTCRIVCAFGKTCPFSHRCPEQPALAALVLSALLIRKNGRLH